MAFHMIEFFGKENLVVPEEEEKTSLIWLRVFTETSSGQGVRKEARNGQAWPAHVCLCLGVGVRVSGSWWTEMREFIKPDEKW